MAKIDDIFEQDIIAKLNTITGVSVLDGFLVHYVKDLLNGTDGLSFPCIAAQLDNDTVDIANDGTQGKIARSVKVIGAVSVGEKSLVNRKLNDLVFNTRKALYTDKFDKKATQATSIKVGNVIYSLPEVTDQYAYFELNILINYSETWK